jgi:pyrophosphatase PpaX
MMWRKAVVLFDWDGTLLDTRDLVRESTRHALALVLGRSVDDETLRPYFGETLERQFRGLVPEADEAVIARLVDAYRAHNQAVHDQWAVPRPGAVAVVRTLHRAGLGLGVVSSKRRGMLDQGLRLMGLGEEFTVIVGLERTRRHKPHPDPIFAALEAWPGLTPRQAVMVGDSPYDMEAAVRAGVDAVAVVSNTFTRDELIRAGAEQVLDDLRDLVPWLRGEARRDTGGVS